MSSTQFSQEMEFPHLQISLNNQEALEAQSGFDGAVVPTTVKQHTQPLSRAAKPYVPKYNPTMSVEDLVLALGKEEVTESDLLQAGYPAYWIRKVLTCQTRKSTLTPFRKDRKIDAVCDSSSASRGPQAVYKKSFTAGEVARFWRIHAPPKSPMVPKPMEYELKSFRAWVHGLAAALAKSTTDKAKYVTGNDACRVLYYGGLSATPSGIASFLQKATVYLADYREQGGSRGEFAPLLMSEYFPDLPTGRLPLEYEGRRYDSEEAWMALKPSMTTSVQKLAFKIGASYLRGEPRSFPHVQKLLRDAESPILPPLTEEEEDPPGPVPGVLPGEIPDPLSYKSKLVWDLPPNERLPYILQGFSDELADGASCLEYQGWLDSTVTHKVMVPGLAEFIEAFGDTSHESQSKIRQLTNLVGGFGLLLMAESWKSLIAALMVIATSSEKAWELTRRILTSLPAAVVERQGIADFLSSIGHDVLLPVWQATLGAMLVTVSEVFLGPLSAVVSPFLMDFAKGVRFNVQKQSAEAMARIVLDAFKEGLERVSSCVKTRSFVPLWGIRNDPLRHVKDVTATMEYKALILSTPSAVPGLTQKMRELREAGLLPQWWISSLTLPEYTLKCQEMLDRGEHLVELFTGHPQVTAELKKCNRALTAFMADLHVMGTMKQVRRVPFTILFHGEAGTGKSVLADTVRRSFAAAENLDVDAHYSWVSGVNFQDGYLPGTWSIGFDDVDHGVAPPAQGVLSYVEHFVHLVNNTPCAIESARVELKGSVYATPELVQITTNFPDWRVGTLTRQPDAFWRRVNLHVEVKVKDEFAKKDGKLDSTKALEGRSHDMFVLRVRDTSVGEVRNVLNLPYVEYSFPAFMRMAMGKYRAHVALHRDILENSQFTSEVCEVCFLPTNLRCGCEVQGFLGDLYEVARNPYGAVRRSVHQLIYPFEAMRQGMAEAVKAPTHLLAAAAGSVAVALAFCAFANLTMPSWFPQGREANSTNGHVPATWTRCEVALPPGLPTGLDGVSFTLDDIKACAVDAFATVAGQNGQQMNAFVAGGSVLIVPTHVADFQEEITIVHKGITHKVRRSPFNSVVLASNPEIMLLRVGGMVGVAGMQGKMRPVIDGSIQQYDELLILGPEVVYTSKTVRTSSLGAQKVLVSDCATKPGNCGMLYVVRHNKAWTVAGMHYAITNSSMPLRPAMCVAAFLTSQEITTLSHSLATSGSGISTVQGSLTLRKEPVDFTPMSHYSEVWVAMTKGARLAPAGQMVPPLGGSSMKTKMSRTPYSTLADLVAFEAKACGTAPFWELPNFRGRMVDGQWDSPWTDAFVTQNHAVPDPDILALAVVDYLSGISKLDTSGYSRYTEEEVVTGIPGSDVHGMNIKTSAGPPFNKSKSHFMYPDREQGSLVDPSLWEMFDHGADLLDRGVVPSFLGLCTLKDEATKPGRAPRVFVCLPAPLNMLMKQSGAWKMFMRANWRFFESAVGINMTSTEVTGLVDYLKEINPDLDRVYEGDARRMDKSWNGDYFDAVSIVVRCMAASIGVDADRMHLLCQSLKHTKYCIKNDVFSFCSWNPSGHDATVELNGIFTSLGMRYVYYREHKFQGDMEQVRKAYAALWEQPDPGPIPGVNFREHNRLVHYGDDNLLTTRFPLGPDFTRIWKEEIGMEMTDASKQSTMTAVPLSRASFLKRTFIWDEELGLYLPPLALTSIARMLVTKKGSSLTDPDHAATVVTEALKEAAYHPVEVFDEIRCIVDQIVDFMQISGNAYLFRASREEYREMMRKGGFQTWSLRPHVAPPPLEDDVTLNYQSNMSDISLVKPSVQEGPSSMEGNITMGSTEVVTQTQTEMSGSTFAQKSFQDLPKDSLDDFMLRPVPFAVTNLFDTDTPFSVKFTALPWVQLLSNLAIADKVKNYTYMRGTIQIVGVVSVPGVAYGSYVLTAYNKLSSSNATTTHQMDHYCELDVAKGNNIVLQLPWISNSEYAAISAKATFPWSIEFCCIRAIATAIPGGLTKGTVIWYASLMDDYELVVPRYQGLTLQGKPALKANATLKRLAPDVHKVIGEGKGSAMAGAVRQAAGILSSVPVIGGFASAVQAGASAAESLLSYFGFTRATAENPPAPVTLRTLTNLSRLDGPDSAETASLTIGNQISIDPTLSGGGVEDETSLASLSERWTLIKTFDWGTDDVTAESLASFPVSPFYCKELATGTIAMTPAGYFGLPFTWWRGDMEYRFLVPLSAAHRGSLQFTWEPSDQVPPINLGVTTNKALIVEMEQGTNPIISVGYCHKDPYLRSTLLTDAMAILPFEGAVNGFIHVHVATPLVAQAAGANTTVYVFARAKNMSFQVPRDSVSYIHSGEGVRNWEFFTGVTLQGGAIGDEGGKEVSLELVPPGTVVPSSELYFGESVVSARALMQKPSQLGTIVETTVVPQYLTKPGGVYPWTWATWYAQLFHGVAASERFKFFTDGGVTHVGVAPVPLGNGLSSLPTPLFPTMSSIDYVAERGGTEVNVPYYTPQSFVKTDRLSRVQATQITLRGPDTGVLYPWYSFGPDIRVSAFGGVPLVVFKDVLRDRWL